jgi:hypothetical protein
MPIEMGNQNGGKVFEVKLIGRQQNQDYPLLVMEFSHLAKERG